MVQTEVCPECRGELIEDFKEIWCKVCGLVLREVIDMSKEIFDESGKRIIYPIPTTITHPITPTRIG